MRKVCGIICGVLLFGIGVTLTVYLGIYAYNNPDPQNCWVVKDLHQCQPSKQLVLAKAKEFAIDVTEGYPLEMHRLFVTWFRWGFWTAIVF